MDKTGGYSDILYSTGDHVATIVINRPKSLNAFTGATIDELSDAISRAERDHDVGVIVLTGAGERAFSSGGDANWEKGGGVNGFDWNLGRRLVDCTKPTLARVVGYAIAGGNHLAYFCDFTVASEDAIFGQNGPRIGSPAGGYVVAHLASVIGHKRAREMWMLCRRYSARQALEWGLVNSVVKREELDAEVAKWCQDLLAVSPTVLKTVKASFRDHMESYMHANVSDTLARISPNYFETGEQQEGVDAFLNKRRPDFSPWR